MNIKIEELETRTVNLLEKTKNNIKKYESQRKILYKFYQDMNDQNIEEWKNYLNYFEKLIEQ